MAQETERRADDQPATPYTQQDLDRARQEGHEAGCAQGLNEGKTIGMELERERIRAILACEPAQVRMSQAVAMALDTDLDLKAAEALLGKSPKENAGAGGPARAVPALAFAGAPRFAGGGEVPAILHRGEEVLTRSDPRHRRNGGGVNITNNFTIQGEASRQSQEQIAARVGDSVRRAMQRNR